MDSAAAAPAAGRAPVAAGGLRQVDDVIGLFERWGRLHYDDRVSQLDHAVQCAALARRDGADNALVAAALLHDLGHLLELDADDGAMGDLEVDRHHEARAARALAGLYPPSVTAPIALHVEAKRYLCAVDEGYAAGLSEGSVRSLATQGGPMSADEVARFETLPRWADAVALRRWDDLGKVEGLTVEPFEDHLPLLRSLVRPA
ncbi:MAG: hypothetical protein RLZZ362_1038 [Actinomycetota bacterium]|jgi:phosphonate degradation associated HDIG domain protein